MIDGKRQHGMWSQFMINGDDHDKSTKEFPHDRRENPLDFALYLMIRLPICSVSPVYPHTRVYPYVYDPMRQVMGWTVCLDALHVLLHCGQCI